MHLSSLWIPPQLHFQPPRSRQKKTRIPNGPADQGPLRVLHGTHHKHFRTGKKQCFQGSVPPHQGRAHGHPIRARPMATPSGRDLRSSHQDETHSYPIRTRPKTIPSGQDPQPPHQDETYGHPIRVGPVASLSYGWIYRAGNSVCFGKRIQALVKKLSKPRNTIPVSVFIPQSLIILSKPSNWIKPIANSHQHLLISNRFIWASQMFRWLATLFPF